MTSPTMPCHIRPRSRWGSALMPRGPSARRPVPGCSVPLCGGTADPARRDTPWDRFSKAAPRHDDRGCLSGNPGSKKREGPTGPFNGSRSHPWTNGQVGRMNRTIEEATVKRFYHDDHEQLRYHLTGFIAADDFGRRLGTLKGLTPCDSIANAGRPSRGVSASIRSTQCRDSMSTHLFDIAAHDRRGRSQAERRDRGRGVRRPRTIWPSVRTAIS